MNMSGMNFKEKPCWPGKKQCAVVFTIHVDGETLYNRGPVPIPRSESYGTYGPVRAVDRILGLMEEEQITCTFFIPGQIGKRYPDMVKKIDRMGHEIGFHGYDHEKAMFTDRPEAEWRKVIARSQKVFRELTGKPLRGFCATSSDFEESAFRVWKDMGFTYSSSMRGDDRPYRVVVQGEDLDFIEIPAKWELDDHPAFAYSFAPAVPKGMDRISSYRGVLSNWKHEFDGYYEEGLCMVFMLHPHIIGSPGRFRMLKELIHYMKEKPDVWFATGESVADWWQRPEGECRKEEASRFSGKGEKFSGPGDAGKEPQDGEKQQHPPKSTDNNVNKAARKEHAGVHGSCRRQTACAGKEILWPENRQAAAMVTVELDNEFIWAAMGEKFRTPKTLSVGTYGILRGLDRILEALDRYKIRATFFVPGKAAVVYPEAVKKVARLGHEIALHGYEHEDFGELNPGQQEDMLEAGIRALTDCTGERPSGFRLPEGNCTPETRRILAEYGFLYDSSFFDHDLPYVVTWEDHKELVEIPMRWETQDFPYLAYGYGFPRGKSRIPVYDQVLENWTDEWEACYDMGFCYGIKFDPQVTGTPGRIYMVDKILRRIRETGAWTATGEELARYTHNYYTRER